jgi:hypothetical protein
VRSFALVDASAAAGVMLAGFTSGFLYAMSPALPFQIALGGAALVPLAILLVRREVRRARAFAASAATA